MRDVDADDLGERRILQQRSDQLAAAAAEIEHPLRAARPEHGHDRAEPLLVQAQRFLDSLLLGLARLRRVAVRVGVLVLEQPRERLARQRALVLEVAVDDQLALGMPGEPALAAAQQLLHLVVADPVVLLRVEHRHEHVEVREQLARA